MRLGKLVSKRIRSLLTRGIIAFAFSIATLHPVRAQTYTLLYSFQGGPDGAGPTTLTKGANGYYYGITGSGGDRFDRRWREPELHGGNGCGTVFKIAP